MLSAKLLAKNRDCNVLLRRAPKGTPSSIQTLQLRRCFHHHQRLYRSLITIPYNSPLRASHSARHSARRLPSIDSATSFRYATTHSGPLPSSISRDAALYVQSLLARPRPGVGVLRSTELVEHSSASDTSMGSHGSLKSSPTTHSTGAPPVHPFQGALLAMREGDTSRVLTQLRVIEDMDHEELQDAVMSLPRTTFTEFFRILDVLRVARDCDPVGESHVSVGMYQILNMTSIDEYGIRRLYNKLVRRLVTLMSALQAAGYTLHLEEYISLIRCCGASSDISTIGALWNDLSSGPLLAWRNSELYTEYIKARFLTEPLYTNYRKPSRMVTPRAMHRSRLMLGAIAVRRLDVLRHRVRLKSLRFGQNKAQVDVDELMRALRVKGPAMRLFGAAISQHSFRVDESLLCALMIAFGRAGMLRAAGNQILERFFGVRNPIPIPGEPQIQSLHSGPWRVRPSIRLIRAIVETYGSNSEISIAVQLVEHLSHTYNIPIPEDVWQDLLEWSHIMSTPPAATAWHIAKLSQKYPGSSVVEVIWDAMTSHPYYHTPTFRNYNVLIRSLISRRPDDLEPALSRMREAILLYNEQCREYEAAVFDYTLYKRTADVPSTIIGRFQRARHKKQMMWFDISEWCRLFLKNVGFSRVSAIPNPLIPHFIEEFRPFLKNPVEYLTPTGRISLVDPIIETFVVIPAGFIEQRMPMKNSKGKWVIRRLLQKKLEILSTHSLAKFKGPELMNPLHLLFPHQNAFIRGTLGRRK
ncbi:mitochondrial ATPase expression-domain-containing protein [Xylaria sp. FL1042]|nr:mitochondrial ATPase expression-domain-containing protein [Xylaria sp. FL1042]